jgi:pimeloyl-ACP methyl ester carboxylesterase
VVALPGIHRRARSLAAVARALRAGGYEVLCPDYPSTSRSLKACADHIHPLVGDFNAGNPGPPHFVTHSMGGFVARVYAARHRPANLGRIAMIAPPNQGSELADLLAPLAPYRWSFGPAGQELTTDRASRLPVPDCPVGVIAGTHSLYPLASLLIPGRNDARVSVERTRLRPGDPHLEVASTYPFIAANPRTHRAVLDFLRDGRFP